MTKRDDILTAAMQIFLQDGLRGARMEKIAESAQVSKRTLYKYFSSKEALFEAIADLVLETLSGMQIPVFDPDQPIEPQLQAALRAYMGHVLTDAFLNGSRILIAELMRSPAFAQEFNASFARTDAPLADFLADAMSCGIIEKGDPKAAADRLLTLFKSTIYLPLLTYNEGVADPERQTKLIEESVSGFLGCSMRQADTLGAS